MTKKQIIKLALDHKEVPYVPWSCGFTQEAMEKLIDHFGSTESFIKLLDNHLACFGTDSLIGFKDIGDECYMDYFGVVWDRSADKDIGVVKEYLLPKPDLSNYQFPDPHDKQMFDRLDSRIAKVEENFVGWSIGFSLYERAWTLRGMENLMMDFIANPDFVHELFTKIADWNIATIEKALQYDIDYVYFGDDWGTQNGLQMGPAIWKEFIKPQLERMYGVVRDAGKYVMIHSCGKVDELFEDLIGVGLNCFNPFQPEVMDVHDLMKQYKGKLSFHGGLSTQEILPYGTTEDVKRETKKLIETGKSGGFIFAPAHSVEGDVPLENMLAFIETLHKQPGYKKKY